MKIQPIRFMFKRNFIKKTNVIPVIALSGIMLSACTNQENSSKLIGMPNPWTDCGQNVQTAAKAAGFEFPLTQPNCHIRAMKDMIEVTYPLDKDRDVIVRKGTEHEGVNDISGDYNNYPVNERKEIYDSVWADFRRDKDRIYVVNFSAESGFFSINCPKGMTMDEVRKIYNIIAAVETSRIPQCPD